MAITNPPPNRREFLGASARALTGGWIAANLPLLAALSACARDAAVNGEPLTTFSAAEGRAFSAFAAQIFPTDGLPGANEAGVVYFADRGLAGPFAGMREPLQAGLADLDERAKGRSTPAESFADLPNEEQIAVMREIEETPFFGMSQALTVMGMFSDPLHGGNRGGVGHQLVNMEHKGSFEAPFGWYDAQELQAARGGAS